MKHQAAIPIHPANKLLAYELALFRGYNFPRPQAEAG